MEEEQKIFKKGSPSFYFSSKFFPKRVRDDVSRLYSFFGTVDNYVDGEDPRPKKFLSLEKLYQQAEADHTFDATAHKWDDIDTRAVKHIVRLQHKYKFDKTWVDDFFASMEMDIDGKEFKTHDQIMEYVHGSAEVVGLMVAKVLKLPEDAYEAAKAQSRAMQWLNFVRDIGKANKRGRCYFPEQELKKFGLKDLSEETAKANPEKFNKFIQAQINRYKKWQTEANEGIQFIPERLQVPIRTSINMYEWTARKIVLNPMVVLEKQVKPRKRQIIRKVIKNTAQGTARVTARTTRQVRSGVKKVKPTAKAAVPKIKHAPEVAKEKAKELKDKYIEIED